MAVLDAQEALLATWNRWVQVALSEDPWVDGRNSELGRNSIMDAELLECVLLPQFYLSRFALGAPAEADETVATVLNGLDPETRLVGGQLGPAVMAELVDRLDDFLARYRSPSGVDLFSPGGYLEMDDGGIASEELPPVVDSFTMSVSVCLHALYLIDQWKENLASGRGRTSATSQAEVERLDGLSKRLSERLTRAMLGLCRSFAVSVEGRDDWEALTQREWPGGGTSAKALRDLGRRLRMFTDSATLRGNAFECGWSWGPTPPDSYEEEYREIDPWPTEELYAEAAPYLYFTIGAIDGISDLFSRKITAAHLLTSTQSALATRLGFYRECASGYWSALAFAETPSGAWAVEDPPWRTSDGSASDYWTLYLLTIALASDEARETFGGEQKLSRLLSLLEELAQRGRVTRRPHPPGADPAVSLHVPPGQQLSLKTVTAAGAPDPRAYKWSIYDFAPRLLKLVGQVLSIATERDVRDRAARLIDDIWNDHLDLRRVGREADAYAWDDIRVVFKDYPVETEADDKVEESGSLVGSWYITERVVEALVAVVAAQQRKTGGRITGELATEILDDLRWMVATEFPDDTSMSRRIAAAIEMAEKSPTLALGIAVEISQAAEKNRRAQAQDTAEQAAAPGDV
jgi:hypothetical protein